MVKSVMSSMSSSAGCRSSVWGALNNSSVTVARVKLACPSVAPVAQDDPGQIRSQEGLGTQRGQETEREGGKGIVKSTS